MKTEGQKVLDGFGRLVLEKDKQIEELKKELSEALKDQRDLRLQLEDQTAKKERLREHLEAIQRAEVKEREKERECDSKYKPSAE